MKNFLINCRKKKEAARRGGGQIHLLIDAGQAENRCEPEQGHHLSPEKLFKKRWAAVIVEEALNRVRFEYAQRGNQPLFEQLKEHLWGECEMSYGQIARHFSMNEGAAHTERVADLALSPDGRFFATASNNQTIKLWQTDSWRMVRTFEGHSGWVGAIAFSPGRTRVALRGR